MNAAFKTEGSTTTQRALSSRSCGISSGTFRISSITIPAFSSRFVSSFAFSSPPRANAAGAIKRAPIRTAFQRFIFSCSFIGLEIHFCLFVKFDSRPAEQMAQQRHKKKNQKDKKQNLCDSRGSRGDSHETENRGDQREDEKPQGPPQHFASSKKCCFKTRDLLGDSVSARPSKLQSPGRCRGNRVCRLV